MNQIADKPPQRTTRSEIVQAGPQGLALMEERGLLAPNTVPMGQGRGGVRFDNMLHVMEFAKMMSTADIGVPKHFRGNPGLCLRVCVQADAWGFDPFAVADKAYSVSDRLGYESQLIHAVIERHAPLDGRLRHRFEGEGAQRVCVVTGYMIGEADPFEWRSPEIGKIKVKNSPEWTNNPDKQLYYHTSRDWARVYCPDVLLGVYSRDELDDTNFGPTRAREVQSDVAARLPGESTGPGFDPENISRTLRGDDDQKVVNDVVASESLPEPFPEQGDSGAQTQKTKPKSRKGAEEKAPPRDVTEYEAHIDTMVAAARDADDLAKAWKDEKKLRETCMVTGEDFDRIKKKVDDKVASLAAGE